MSGTHPSLGSITIAMANVIKFLQFNSRYCAVIYYLILLAALCRRPILFLFAQKESHTLKVDFCKIVYQKGLEPELNSDLVECKAVLTALQNLACLLDGVNLNSVMYL